MKIESVPRSELLDILGNEEEKIVSSFPLEARIGLIELARAADEWFMHTMNRTRGDDPDGETSDFHALYRYGANKAICLFIDSSCHNTGFPMLQPTEHSLGWAHSVIQQCGRIAQVEQYLHLNKTGLMALTRREPNEYCFSFISNNIGLECLERQHFDWLRNQITGMQKSTGELLNRRYPDIIEQLTANVFPCPVHGIGYSSAPDLDDYYEQAGMLRSQLMLGQDSFPEHAPFGGQEFNLYRAVTTLLVGWTLKHVAFCNVLARKYPDTILPSIATIHTRADDLSRQIADTLNITQQQAGQALQALVLTPDNKLIHCSRTAGAPSPFIEVGNGHLLWRVAGCLDAPFEFMVAQLKHQYVKDWDRNLNQREHCFRDDVYQLFPQERFINARKSVNVKADGKLLTDVDAAIYDSQAQVLALFQLKWQELIGSAMLERASRKTNFMREANHWVDVVSHWLDSISDDEIADVFSLPRASMRKIKHIRLFVVGRNSAFFSDALPDDRAAWGIWPQVIRFSHDGFDGKLCDDADPVSWLYYALKKDAPASKSAPEVERQEIRLGKVKVIGIPPNIALSTIRDTAHPDAVG